MKSHYFILGYYTFTIDQDYLLELFMSTSSTTASVCQILMLGQCISGSKITLSTVIMLVPAQILLQYYPYTLKNGVWF